MERVPLEKYHSSLARRWIPADRKCLQNAEYLTNTFIVKASAFPEEHLCNRQGMALVLSLDEDYGTLLDDLHYMFGEQGLAKLYLYDKNSEHRCRVISEENLGDCLIWLRQSPTKWRLDIQFVKRPKGLIVIPEEQSKDVAFAGCIGWPEWEVLDMEAGDEIELLPNNVHQKTHCHR